MLNKTLSVICYEFRTEEEKIYIPSLVQYELKKGFGKSKINWVVMGQDMKVQNTFLKGIRCLLGLQEYSSATLWRERKLTDMEGIDKSENCGHT